MEAVLIQAINRLEGILVSETDALRSGRMVDLGETSNSKNMSLLELTRISRGLDRDSVTPALADRLTVLKDRLEDNSRMLSLHMEAASEISGIISRAIRDAESDGTYGSSIRGVTLEK